MSPAWNDDRWASVRLQEFLDIRFFFFTSNYAGNVKLKLAHYVKQVNGCSNLLVSYSVDQRTCGHIVCLCSTCTLPEWRLEWQTAGGRWSPPELCSPWGARRHRRPPPAAVGKTHNIQLTFHGVTGVAQTHHGAANAAKDNTNTPVIRSPGCESMLSAWELQSRMCVPPGGVLIGSCFSFPLPLIGRQPRLTGPKGSLIRDNLKYHNIKAVVIYIAVTFL